MPPSRKKPDIVTIFPNFDLHRACAAGNLGLVQYAITQGQPVNSVLAGVLPLHAAASGGNDQVVKTLILAGADVNAPRLSSRIGPPQDVGGIATVVGPSHKGRLGSASSASGQSTSYRPGSSSSGMGVSSASAPTMGRRGSTPLHFAAAMGHPNIVKILLDSGADPNARDYDKMRPIDAARAASQSKTVRLLEEFEAPRYHTANSVTSSDFTSNPFSSTPSLLGDTVPANPNGSTSSLGRYPAPQPRPSLPSIYESPPATALPTVKAEATRKHPLRRPRSAGATATHSSSDTSTNTTSSSRIGRIFRKTSSRPSTASAALQSPNHVLTQANHERQQTAQPMHAVPLQAKTTIGKAIERSLHHHHIPILHHSHTPLPHISTEDISAPMAHVMGPSRSDLVRVRPDKDKPTAPEPQAGESDFYQLQGGLSALELHHAAARGMDSFRPIRTAPPTQTVFSFEPIDNGQDPQMPRDLTGPPAVPRHRLGLAGYPDRMQSQTPEAPRPRMDSNTTPGSASSGAVTDDAAVDVTERQQRQGRRLSHFGLPSPIPMPHPAPPQAVNRSRAASVSSIETESSGAVSTPNSAATVNSSINLETVPVESNSSKLDETRKDNASPTPVSPTSSNEHSPSPTGRSKRKSSHSSFSKSMTTTHTSTSIAMRMSRTTRNASPGGRGLGMPEDVPPVPPVDTTWVASRAHAKELVEAHRRAIESELSERAKRRRGASASTDHPLGSLGKSVHPSTALDEQQQRSNDSPVQQSEETSEEETLTGAALRERLAALGTTVQLERRFARGEKQGKSWNRSIDATGKGGSSTPDSRTEMLDKFFDPEAEEKTRSDSQKPPAPPKKDVFGRPITPKEKERRPTTPKDIQTAARPKSPFSSRVTGAPRENRVLPPPDKSVRLTGLSPAGPGHMPHRTRSDHSLPYVNKEEVPGVPGRDRAWTTIDVRPRGPVSARNELSPAIEIVQTSPTPTEGPSPIRQNMDRSYVRDAIYVEDEHNSVMMWEQQASKKSKRSNRPSTAPLLSSSGPPKHPETPSKRRRDASASPRVYQASLPGVPEVHAQATDPKAASHPQLTISTDILVLDSPTSSLEVDIGEPLTRATPEPLEATPSAVDLHNIHIARSRDLDNLSYTPPQAIHMDHNSGIRGYHSVQSMNADKSWRLLGVDAASPLTDASKYSPTKAKKLTGFFSRLKR